MRYQALSVGCLDGREERGVVEKKTGVEEIGRLAAAFEGVGAEGKDISVETGLEEGSLIWRD